jgi:hypothetical protein
MTQVTSIAQIYLKRRLLLYIEFKNNVAKSDFCAQLTNNILISSACSLYIPVDIAKGDFIVTLTGVQSITSNEHIQATMSEFGCVRSVHNGVHIGPFAIDNGKRYVVFDGPCQRTIPRFVTVNTVRIHVQYSGDFSPSHVRQIDTTNMQKGKTTGPWPQTAPELQDTYISDIQYQYPMDQGPRIPEHVFPDKDLQPLATVHKETQTMKEKKCSRSQQTEARPKMRSFGSMVTGVNRRDTATNTDHPELVDAQVQRNYHVKKKGSQTDPIGMINQEVQCHICSGIEAGTQTITLEDEVREIRCSSKTHKKVIIKKRKRTQSGQISDMAKCTKSRQFNSNNIQQYFVTKRPKVVEKPESSGANTTCTSQVGDSDFKFKFHPKVSWKTFCLTTSWQYDHNYEDDTSAWMLDSFGDPERAGKG